MKNKKFDMRKMDKKEKDCCFTDGNNWFRYRAGAIIIEDGYILFVGSENSNYLYTVGGGVHMGETAEDCVKREVYEETGRKYEIDRLAAVCENFFKGNGGIIDSLDCHCLELYFVMKSKRIKDLKGNSYNADGDKEELKWIPIDKIDEYNIKPSFLKEKIKEIIESNTILHIVSDKDR